MVPNEKCDELDEYFEHVLGAVFVDEFTQARYQRAAEAVLDGDPESPSAHDLMGILCDRADDVPGALMHFQRAFDADSTAHRALNVVLYQVANDQMEAAEALMLQVLGAAPELFDGGHGTWPHYVACMLLIGTGRVMEAQNEFDKACEEMDPQSAVDTMAVGYIAADLGDVATATELAARLLVLWGMAEWSPEGGIATIRTVRMEVIEKLPRRIHVAVNAYSEMTAHAREMDADSELAVSDEYLAVVDGVMEDMRPFREHANRLVLGALDE